MTGSVATLQQLQAVALEPVDAVTVTILIDNVSDMLLEDQGPAKRVGDADRPLPQRPWGCSKKARPLTNSKPSTASRRWSP
jgi:hypothetical protein